MSSAAAGTQPEGPDRGSRALIREAAAELFARDGYAQATVRQIAARAGVSPGLVIKLMGTKADLYRQVGAHAAASRRARHLARRTWGVHW